MKGAEGSGPGAGAPAPITTDPSPGFLRALLHLIYDAVWLAGAAVASPWWIWRCWRDAAFRRMAWERLGGDLGYRPRPDRRGRILVHGVSVGEVKGAASLVEALERAYPDLEVVVSTTTNTGMEVARGLYPGRAVVRFPLDFSPLVSRFLDRVDPLAVVLVELEIWPNFLRLSNRRGAPVAVVNGRITTKSFLDYRVFRRLLPQFNRITLFCAQLDEYAERFSELCGRAERVLVTGNLKADGMPVGPIDPGPELRSLLGAGEGGRVLVAGSTHEPEEEIVARAWREGAPDARLVIVPRHPHRLSAVLESLDALGIRAQALSRLRAGEQEPDPARPVVVDTIGELERVYGLADLVFVGGSLLPHGGQNMLEPAAQGRPVLYGPHVDNFAQETTLLESAGASLRVVDGAALTEAIRRLMRDPDARRRMSEAGLTAVQRQKGATALTLEAFSDRCLRGPGLAVP